MGNPIVAVEDIKKLADKARSMGKKASELDTQCILVEPILEFAGYDVRNPEEIKRAVFRKPDIILNKGDKILIIETKSIGSSEFNLEISENKSEGKPKLEWKNNKKGELSNESSENYNGDGVGQLRRYCMNFKEGNKNENKEKTIIPILTNGVVWVLFELDKFTENPNEAVDLDETVKSFETIENADNFIEKVIKEISP